MRRVYIGVFILFGILIFAAFYFSFSQRLSPEDENSGEIDSCSCPPWGEILEYGNDCPSTISDSRLCVNSRCIVKAKLENNDRMDIFWANTQGIPVSSRWSCGLLWRWVCQKFSIVC